MKRRMRRSAVRSAFTLLEVMLVLVIIAAIAGIAVYNIGGIRKSALTKVAKSQLSTFKNALEQYKLTNAPTYPSTLQALHDCPSDVDASTFVPVLKDKVPKDPWDREYKYESSGEDYKLFSVGPDGQEGTADDISA